MNNTPQTPFEDIVDQIMLEESAPDHAVLMRWAKRYPEHRDALARFFATWAVQEKSPEKVPVDEDVAGSRMVSKALNILYHQASATAGAVAPQPQRLCQVIKSCGRSEAEVARRCELDDSLLTKLDLRRINFKSIPRKLFRCLAEALGETIEAIRALLSGGPIPAGANMSRGKPVITTEDFLDAVRSSDLPDEAKTAWTAAVTEEKAEEEA